MMSGFLINDSYWSQLHHSYYRGVVMHPPISVCVWFISKTTYKTKVRRTKDTLIVNIMMHALILWRGQRKCPQRSLIGLDKTMLTLCNRDHREKEEKDGFSFAFVNFKLHLFLIHKLSAKEKFLGRSSSECCSIVFFYVCGIYNR